MHRMNRFLKTLVTPVTIMVVPHSRARPIGLRVPWVGILFSIVIFVVGTGFVVTVSVRTVEYNRMQERLVTLSSHLREIDATMASLKAAEEQFRKLFSLKSKREVLETYRIEDAGSLDMGALKKQIDASMESVAGIRTYIAQQRDIYLATPAGWPVPGRISSDYGSRDHPLSGDRKFHSGVDISIPEGSRVKATADGIVSYAGWSAGSGHTIVIEHGHGFSTAFAHNRQNLVRVGQKVRRGDVIALSGSTGLSTGPHVHYEIWKNGRHVNPGAYFARG